MNASIRQLTTVAGTLALFLGSVSCGNLVRQGRSPSFLVIDSLQGVSGTLVPLLSDVVTKGTINNDTAQAEIRLVLKDPGSPSRPSSPSLLNAITISRYHVNFVRTDGRNTPGVDVPYAFDGGVTATIDASTTTVRFEIVRHNAKEEAPLKALVGGGGRIVISTIAEVTFYGRDLAGNDVQATGTLSVNFADFADP